MVHLLLLVLTVSLPAFSSTNKVSIQANLQTKGFYLDKKDNPNTDEGISSRLQLDLKFKNVNSWSINSTVQTYYDWAGDRRQDGGAGSNYVKNDNQKQNPDNFSIDKLFVEKYANKTLFRIGRQEANWANGFNINNDRRDRLLALRTFKTNKMNYTLISLYDLRFSNNQYNFISKVDDRQLSDLHMYAVAIIGSGANLSWGTLYALFSGGSKNSESNSKYGYNIDQFHQIAPYLKYSHNKFTIDSSVTLNFSNSNKSTGSRKFLWGNDSQAGYFKLGFKLNSHYSFETQVAHFNKGGYIGRGWDSFSSLYNNSSRNDASPVRLFHFGGIGDDNNSGELAAIRLTRSSDNSRHKLAYGLINIFHEFGATTNRFAKFIDFESQFMIDEYSNFSIRIGHSDQNKSILTKFKVKFE